MIRTQDAESLTEPIAQQVLRKPHLRNCLAHVEADPGIKSSPEPDLEPKDAEISAGAYEKKKISVLRKLRQENGLTTVDLAGLIGVNQSSVSNWELGKFGCSREEIQQRIAEVFDTEKRKIFSSDGTAKMTIMKVPRKGTRKRVATLRETPNIEEHDAQIKPKSSARKRRKAQFYRHTYRLRPGVTLELELPADLSRDEATRLSTWASTLAC